MGALYVPVGAIQFNLIWLFGGVIVAGFGIVVIPILIVSDVFRLLGNKQDTYQSKMRRIVIRKKKFAVLRQRASNIFFL